MHKDGKIILNCLPQGGHPLKRPFCSLQKVWAYKRGATVEKTYLMFNNNKSNNGKQDHQTMDDFILLLNFVTK